MPITATLTSAVAHNIPSIRPVHAVHRTSYASQFLAILIQLILAPIDWQFIYPRHHLVQLLGAFGKERSVLVNLILRRIGVQLTSCREVSQEQILEQLHLVRRLLWGFCR